MLDITENLFWSFDLYTCFDKKNITQYQFDKCSFNRNTSEGIIPMNR